MDLEKGAYIRGKFMDWDYKILDYQTISLVCLMAIITYKFNKYFKFREKPRNTQI